MVAGLKMLRLAVILLLVIVYINVVKADTEECKLSNKRIKRVSKRFKNWCLKKGPYTYREDKHVFVIVTIINGDFENNFIFMI